MALGAFLFGVGMQLGGGCASGTLTGAGGGSLRMAITLGAFIAGSVIGTAHLPWWLDQPSLAALSIPQALGWPAGLAAQLAALGLLALGAIALERRRHGGHEPLVWGAGTDWRRHLLLGGWPLAWGALALALLNLATLLIAGHPWSVTWGFALWGASLADALGFGIADWTFWQWPRPARALAAGVTQDTVSVMNAGPHPGRAAGCSPRRPLRAPAPALRRRGGERRHRRAAARYGARLAFGCNIGAFFSGIASGSAHGWLWLLAALPGAALGARLRPLFGLDNGPGACRRRSSPMSTTTSTTTSTPSGTTPLSRLQRLRKALPAPAAAGRGCRRHRRCRPEPRQHRLGCA